MEEKSSSFIYEKEADGLAVTGIGAAGLCLRIPERAEGLPVVSIGKKAFWGCESVREVILPDTVRYIGEWAFASCKSLECVSVPHRDIRIGRGVFRGCDSLTQLQIRNPVLDGKQEGIGRLLVAGDRLLGNGYLLNIRNAGSMEWYAQWDASLQKLMEQPDDEGFSKMLLCGEEDYGSRENNIDHYCAGKRRRKARAALLRLRYDDLLGEGLRGILVSFIRSHTKGCAAQEAWEVLTEEHGDEKEYYRMFAGIGGIHDKNREQCIADLGERHTEMKAYLLGQQEDAGGDFFASLEL